ncbi:MAG: hypothetical protein LRZ85_09410 [Alphaproteobacteria bacterium]|nr:hypothetical protein [Alphaproteobacteria bacterium]MCD8520431.1 hypothetical protein [Alphaproteobacteria bacterium]
MKVNVQQFLADAGITEPFYPGKRLVQPCRQSGDFKSHCVVLDWRDPERIRIEVKPGLSGKTLAVEQVKQYPVSFQTPTFVEIEVVDTTKSARTEDDEEEGEEGKARGKSGGGSKGQKKGRSLSDISDFMNKAFSDIAEGKIPESGKITEMVVMGMQIAQEAFDKVFDKLTQQINHAKVATTDLLAEAGKFITRYTPPAFLQPKGNEDKVYKYDINKNENIGFTGPSMV